MASIKPTVSFDDVFTTALRVFNDNYDSVMSWLNAPHPVLHTEKYPRSPLSVMNNNDGRVVVLSLLSMEDLSYKGPGVPGEFDLQAQINEQLDHLEEYHDIDDEQ